MELNINTSCTLCGKCVKICPAHIFKIDQGAVTVVNFETCIVCGHCAGVCPSTAIEHSEFPPQKVHPIDYEALPTPEQLLLLMRSRRSNRAFSTKPVPTTFIDLIIEAAHRAPTGSNVQNVSFTIVTDPKKVRAIAQNTITIFSKIAKKLRNPILKPILKLAMPKVYKMLPLFDKLKTEFETGTDGILRGATTVIFFHTPTKSRLGVQDCNLAFQNGSLMAENLAVSQVYLGFVLIGNKTASKKHKLENILGIDGQINAAMGIGMPQFRFENYIDRKDAVVTKI